jgi:hypothetical protein
LETWCLIGNHCPIEREPKNHRQLQGAKTDKMQGQPDHRA